jgi:mono/diheme cytochrome c family protein
MRLLLGMLLLSGTAHAAPEGSALYAQHCAACHQADGSGAVGLAPALKGEHWGRLGADRSYLAAVLQHGLSGPIVVNGQRFVGSMPGFSGQMDDAQLAAVATHLLGLQGRSGEAYTAAELKAARDAGGSPPQSRERRAQLLK